MAYQKMSDLWASQELKTQAEINPATHWNLCIRRKAWDKLYLPCNLLEPSNPSCQKYHHRLTKAKCTMGIPYKVFATPQRSSPQKPHFRLQAEHLPQVKQLLHLGPTVQSSCECPVVYTRMALTMIKALRTSIIWRPGCTLQCAALSFRMDTMPLASDPQTLEWDGI